MADPNVVPRADLASELGTVLKRWATAYMQTLHVTGQLTDGTNSATLAEILSGTIDNIQVTQATLTALDIANKYLDTGKTPNNLTRVLVLVGGAPTQDLGSDYTVSPTGRISWNGLGMDGQVEAGEEMTVFFF